MNYGEIDPKLDELLLEFGPPRRTRHPEYPFWHLRSDGIWEVVNADELPKRAGKSNPNPSRTVLIERTAEGGFTPEIQRALESDPSLLREVARRLLDRSFPGSIHAQILSGVGLALPAEEGRVESRDPRFREEVLRAYEYRCCICGYKMMLEGKSVGLEAGHIKWIQAGGPDFVVNGLSLCALHHTIFDLGAFTVSPRNFLILFSQRVHGDTSSIGDQLKLHGREIHFPQSKKFLPKAEYLDWHYDQVFHAPAREEQ